MKTRISRRARVAAAALAIVSTGSAAGFAAAASNTDVANTDVEGEIRLLTPIFEGSDGQEALENVVLPAFYEQYPNVEVTVEYTTYGDLNEKLVTSLAGGLVPDVMLMGVGWVEGFADQGILADLDQFGVTAESVAGAYNEQVLRAGIWEDRLYALPIMLDARLGVYRADILEEAGIESPGDTWTWAELRDAAIALTVRDEGGDLERAGLDVLSWDARQIWETFLFSNGGELFEDGAPAFNSPAGVEALEYFSGLIAEDRVIDPGFNETGTEATLLTLGQAAIAVGHHNVWTNAADYAPDIQEQLRPFILEGAEPAFFYGGTLATMSASSEHPEAAAALVQHLASPDAALLACQQRGNIPAHNELLDSEYVQNHAIAQFVMENIQYGHPEGGVPSWLEIRAEFAAAVEAAYLGQKSPQEALDDLAVLAQEAIDRYESG